MTSEMDVHRLSIYVVENFKTLSKEDFKWKSLKEFSIVLRKSEFSKVSSDYHLVASALIDSLRPTLFSEPYEEKLFDEFFLFGISHEAFLILIEKLEKSCESYQQKKILDVLLKFLKGESLENLLLHQCSNSGTWDPKYVLLSRIWDDLITYLVSVPDRVANKTKGEKISKIFRTVYYVPLIASTIIKVFSVLHDKIANSQNCTLEFIGKLVGRLCIVGHADILAKRFCLEFIKQSESNFIWRKLSQNLISKMPIISLESFVTHLLLIIPWYGYVDWILGEETIKSQKLNFLMTVKLTTIKHFQEKIILQNIIGHYACSESRQDQFWKIFESFLKNWTNSYNLKYQSHDQQIYIAVGLMICCRWLQIINNTSKPRGYISQVLEGTQARISCPVKLVRVIGMTVASELTSLMQPEDNKLQFEELEDEEIVSFLKSFTKIQLSPEKDYVFFKEDLKCFAEVEAAQLKWKNHDKERNSSKQTDTDTLFDESDDDLEPFDMTSSTVLKKLKHPLYLNDCLQGLIEQNDREWFEECLKHAEHLINTSDNVQEFAEEMAKVMLHLDNKFNLDSFIILRMQILESLINKCPILVSKYLTGEFYERNYNIQQRLDILEVLSRSSLRLSQLDKSANEATIQIPKQTLNSKQTWQLIVDERIAVKTKHKTKGPRKPTFVPIENIFAPVAGFFFFPLIHNFHKKGEVLKLFGEDSLILGKLIYTLGIIMFSASNIPISSQMGETLLEFISSIWNHEATVVREAVLFTLITVYESVPGFLLFAPDSNLQLAVLKSLDWLQSVVASELDINCQVKASVVQSFIMKKMKEELPSIPGFT